jgi:hypothetical protein
MPTDKFTMPTDKQSFIASFNNKKAQSNPGVLADLLSNALKAGTTFAEDEKKSIKQSIIASFKLIYYQLFQRLKLHLQERQSKEQLKSLS